MIGQDQTLHDNVVLERDSIFYVGI